jgi:hypothetical protein
VLKAQQLNMEYSLQVGQEMLSQFYGSVLLGLFQRGSHGYYFSSYSDYPKRFVHGLTRGCNAFNELAGWSILNRSS